MEWLNWKTIVALAVLVTPMAYCTMDEQRVFNEARVACIQQQGEWTRAWGDGEKGPRSGGKVVWLTDKQLTLARIKYPYKEFDTVLEKDRLENYKKYLDQTIE